MARKRAASRRVEADVDAASPASRSGAASSARRWPLVVIDQVVEPGDRASRSTSVDDVLAHRRLAAGQADPAHAQRWRRRRTSRSISSNGEHVGAWGRTSHALLGHAVGAAVVAAIGQRDAQVADALRANASTGAATRQARSLGELTTRWPSSGTISFSMARRTAFGGAGHREKHRSSVQPGDRARQHRRGPDLLEGEHAEELAEAVETFVEQRATAS